MVGPGSKWECAREGVGWKACGKSRRCCLEVGRPCSDLPEAKGHPLPPMTHLCDNLMGSGSRGKAS